VIIYGLLLLADADVTGPPALITCVRLLRDLTWQLGSRSWGSLAVTNSGSPSSKGRRTHAGARPSLRSITGVVAMGQPSGARIDTCDHRHAARTRRNLEMGDAGRQPHARAGPKSLRRQYGPRPGRRLEPGLLLCHERPRRGRCRTHRLRSPPHHCRSCAEPGAVGDHCRLDAGQSNSRPPWPAQEARPSGCRVSRWRAASRRFY
jgi:hypothetical protein